MNRLSKTMILVIVLIGASSLLFAEEAADGIAGTYTGQVFSGGKFIPMEMRISENADRGLAGEYTMKEESGDEVGSLELETRVDDDVFVFSWTDKYGTGRLKMLFSGDKRSFFGFWNAADEPLIYAWAGSKD